MSQRIETTSSESGGYRTWADSEPEKPDKYPQWGFHVQIKDPEGTGIGAEIWLDGKRVEHTRRFSVDVGLNKATEVTIVVLAQSVNREPLP